jgi:hypothetical protein
VNEIVERYFACWNETDPDARRTLIDQAWAADGYYVDPLAEARGAAAIDATIAAAQGQFPGLVFTRAGAVDAHHRQARFRWHLGPAGGESLVDGFDVLQTDEDGKITAVLGFLDRVPS